MKLTYKEKKFVELYNGNASDTARLAGYSLRTAPVIGCQKLKKLNKFIQEREVKALDKPKSPYIPTREERQGFWAEVMFSNKVGMNERLRASELLGKSEADFTEKLEHTGVYNVRPSEEMIALFDEFRERRNKLINVDKCT